MKTWQVYDPNIGADRTIELSGHGCVSTLAHRFWVLEGGPGTSEPVQLDILDLALRSYAGNGYLTLLPWMPGHKANASTFRRLLSSTIDIGGTLYATGIQVDSLREQFLDIWSTLGCRRAGLWSVGITSDTEEFLRRVRLVGEAAASPISRAAAALPVLQGAVCLDDGVDMILLRDTQTASSDIRELADRLRLRA